MSFWFRLPIVLLVLSVLAACGSRPQQTSSEPGSGTSSASSTRGGGFYLDDGPSLSPPAGLASIPDPLPSVLPFASGPNRPYTVFGRRYVPDTSGAPFVQEGVASWYGRRYHGRQTSSGEIYDMYAMTAAHPTLPIPSYARVTRLDSGQQVLVRINDRGPFLQERVIDLSYAAATRLGFVQAGQTRVRVERLMPDEIARIRAERQQAQTTDQTQPTSVVVSNPTTSGVILNASANDTTHFIQFGAFGNPDNARRLLEEVRSELSMRSEPVELWHDGQLWRVQLGPLGSRGRAEEVVQEIQTGTGRQTTIVRR